ncbi:hypothetical protein [Methylocella tundrae]|uniref:hypothetical protein n=1 Tax=Methylocella tundrae TaxID=227605 RepID=UPI0030FF1E6E|nr:hypothetical protein SIN04_16720 [Methylocella tundrae]
MPSRFAPSLRLKGQLIAFTILSSAFGLALVDPAAAESVRKECSQKYQAAKAAGTLNGQAWPQFYSQCAAEAKGAAPAATPAATPAAAPAPAAPPPPPAAPPAANPLKPAPAPAAVGNAVFPSAVSAAYANEKPGKARMKTCLDQYNANKATNANGGLKWIQKGGGYYSQCNARLKS